MVDIMDRNTPFGSIITLPSQLREEPKSFHTTLSYLVSRCRNGEMPVGIYMNRPNEYCIVVVYTQERIDNWYAQYVAGKYSTMEYRSVPRDLAMSSQGIWKGTSESTTITREAKVD